MELTMFQRLQEQPLLQGLSLMDMNEIVEKVRLDFQQLSEDEIIAMQETSCKQLVFILRGTVRVEYLDPSNRYRFCEYISAPTVIEPQSMFGLSQRYQRSYICETDCQTLSIERVQFLGIMMNKDIVKVNTLNLVCNLLQRSNKRLTNITHLNADEKLRQFFIINSINPKGKKKLYAKMETLADMFSETRLNVSRALKRLNDEGLMKQERKEFTIHALENLL